MLWALGAISLGGMVIGAVFRAPALVAASGLIVVAGGVTAPFVAASVASLVVFLLCALAVLQASYLVGLVFSSRLRDKRMRFARLLRNWGEC